MKLIAIDPGITTGVALFENGALKRTLTLDENIELLESIEYDHVVIEKPPSVAFGKFESTLRTLHAELRQIYPNAVYVQPGTWKNSFWARTALKFNTKHEKDAYCLGMYALNTLFQEAV